MGALIDDEVLHTICVCGTPAEVAATLRSRYARHRRSHRLLGALRRAAGAARRGPRPGAAAPRARVAFSATTEGHSNPRGNQDAHGRTGGPERRRSQRSGSLPARRAPRDVRQAPQHRTRHPLAGRARGHRLLGGHALRPPARGEPPGRRVLVEPRWHADHRRAGGRRRGAHAPRLDHARHGSAEAHALPQARQPRLHAAHDRTCSRTTSRTARASSSTASARGASATSSPSSRPSCRCRRSPR